VANNGTNTSTGYNATCFAKIALTVAVAGGPTGTTFVGINNASNITNGSTTGRSIFAFATESGQISAWTPTVNGAGRESRQLLGILYLYYSQNPLLRFGCKLRIVRTTPCFPARACRVAGDCSPKTCAVDQSSPRPSSFNGIGRISAIDVTSKSLNIALSAASTEIPHHDDYVMPRAGKAVVKRAMITAKLLKIWWTH